MQTKELIFKNMMFNKRILISAISIVSIFALSFCSGKKETKDTVNHVVSKTDGLPEIKFDTTYYDFGTLVQGEQVEYTFKFKNIGDADLIIFDAYSMCGCTVPHYSEDPIHPGEEGKIEVVFNSEGKHGLQYKTVTLKLNTEIDERTLTIKANVLDNNYKS